jgi:hypothetical protein
METNVSEAVLPPSSGYEFMNKEMYPLQSLLPREVPDELFEVFRAEKRKLWFSRLFNPEDGGSTASETLVSNHQIITRRKNPENRGIYFCCRENVSNYA